MIVARKQILVQLTDDLVAVLDRQARRRSVSRSQVIREAIEQYTHD
ncbi:MAG: ribbon-helix-helix domain-containing protein, partial [Gaiellaceae bacterium]